MIKRGEKESEDTWETMGTEERKWSKRVMRERHSKRNEVNERSEER